MRRFLVFLLVLLPLTVQGRIVQRDDQGKTVVLEMPAGRIVSLAPSITELLFAAGAGGRIVGAVEYSDYPEQALKIARVGGAQALDIEKIASLKPDLVVAWSSGNSPGQIGRLIGLGIPVFYVEPRHLSQIPDVIARLGMLAGSESVANKAALEFKARLSLLKSRYSGKPSVRVFYEIWPNPLMTVNDDQIISDVLKICGAKNPFGNLPILTPTLSFEAVLRADPAAIIASGQGNRRPPWLDDWKKWDIAASRRGNLFFVPSDLISRPSPRILDGAEILCKEVEQARNR